MSFWGVETYRKITEDDSEIMKHESMVNYHGNDSGNQNWNK